MKRNLNWRAQASIAATLAFALSLTGLSGCSSGTPTSGTAQNSPAYPQLTGNWQIAGQSAIYKGTTPGISAYLSSTAGAVTGIAHVTNSNCFTYGTDLNLSGTIDPSGNIQLTSAATNGQTVKISGVATSNSSQISGQYQITGGCGDGDKGTIGGVKYADISGTYKGTLASITGTLIGTTVQITQTAPDKDGFFHFVASATFTGSPCFQTAAVGSSGTAVLLGNQFAADLVPSSDSATQIQIGGTILYDSTGTIPTKLESSYLVHGGLCTGDTGSGLITKQ